MSKQEQVVVAVSGLTKGYSQGGANVAVLNGLKMSIRRG